MVILAHMVGVQKADVVRRSLANGREHQATTLTVTAAQTAQLGGKYWRK
tara:strand:+ start:428 stop:574 length:147 start_codon:yes stop_codon:yes gene_type:complete